MRRALVLAAIALSACGEPSRRQADAREDNLTQRAENVFGVSADAEGAMAACFTREEERMSPDSMTLEQRQQKIGCLNEQVVRQIRPVLPKRIDQLTTMVNIEAAGPVLNYYYKVDADANALPADARETIEREVRANVCGTPQMSQTIGYGGVYHYHYADQAGRPIHDVRIDHC